jgi:hypothetical protein
VLRTTTIDASHFDALLRQECHSSHLAESTRHSFTHHAIGSHSHQMERFYQRSGIDSSTTVPSKLMTFCTDTSAIPFPTCLNYFSPLAEHLGWPLRIQPTVLSPISKSSSIGKVGNCSASRTCSSGVRNGGGRARLSAGDVGRSSGARNGPNADSIIGGTDDGVVGHGEGLVSAGMAVLSGESVRIRQRIFGDKARIACQPCCCD